MISRAIPYEGKEPYIFLSYCHKDAETVYSLLEQMVSDGYRIWYDDGNHAGDDWLENIAMHLNGASVCLAMISEKSAASHNCKSELNGAIEWGKKLVAVVLEDFRMPLGMRLQLNTFHYLRKSEYPSEHMLLEKLYQTEALSACKAAPGSLPMKNIASVNPNAAREEAARQEAARQEAARRKAAQEEAARQEEARRKAAQEEAARQEAARQEAARQKAAQEEAARQEAARQEAARQKAAQEEAARQEAARQKAAQEEAARQEAARQEAARQKAAQEEAARQEAARQKAAQEEAARQEAARRKAAQEEAARQEAARQKAAQEEAARQEAARQKAAQEEAARQEAARQKAAQEEAARQEAARQKAAQEAAEQEADDQDATCREPLPGEKNLGDTIIDEDDMDGVTVRDPDSGYDDGEDGTVCAERQPTAILVRLTTGVAYPLNAILIRMGRSKSQCDVVINDNSYIGKCHAEIVYHKNRFYLRDRASVNGTYVDGRKLEADENVELQNYMVFSLYNEPFMFFCNKQPEQLISHGQVYFLRNTGTRGVKVVTNDELYLGRKHKWEDGTLDDEKISRKHAVVTQAEDKLFLEDLGSLNNTFLNKAPIRDKGKMEIREKDQIRLGSTVLEVGIFRLQGEET